MKQTTECNLCASESLKQFLKAKSHVLVRCDNCGLVFVNPLPTDHHLQQLYSEDYFSCADPISGGYEDYEGERDNIISYFKRRLKAISDKVETRDRLLDVGCAMGFFIEVAAEDFAEVHGVEVSRFASEKARRKLESNRIFTGTLTEALYPDEFFDVVTMWDLIEHSPDPKNLLAEAHRILKEEGLLVITTPNSSSLLARAMRKRWLGYQSPGEHLFYFSDQTLGRMLNECGFDSIEIRSVGKTLDIQAVVTRLHVYSSVLGRVSNLLAQALGIDKTPVYLNSGDTMIAYAIKASSLSSSIGN